MVINSFPGFFIDIEGIDGAGQTTQVTLVSERLKKEGLPVVVTGAAPKETPFGKLIREILNHKVVVSLEALEFLFAADHWERTQNVVIPALKKGKIVISDRSVWSFIAYGALGMEKDWLFNLLEKLVFPDLSIFLKISPRVALKRISASRPTYEFFEKEKTLRKIGQNYASLARQFSDKIQVVDGEREKEEVAGEIAKIIKGHPKFESSK